MFILLTTANFPNVMLPAYNTNRWACLYFIFFLMMGLYFLQNVLLATIFDNYKKRVQEKFDLKSKDRSFYIEQYFERFDRGKKGYLNLSETKTFFALIFELDYMKSKDRVTFRKIMKLVDVDNERLVYKQNVLQFFSLPNFLEVIVV